MKRQNKTFCRRCINNTVSHVRFHITENITNKIRDRIKIFFAFRFFFWAFHFKYSTEGNFFFFNFSFFFIDDYPSDQNCIPRNNRSDANFLTRSFDLENEYRINRQIKIIQHTHTCHINSCRNIFLSYFLLFLFVQLLLVTWFRLWSLKLCFDYAFNFAFFFQSDSYFLSSCTSCMFWKFLNSFIEFTERKKFSAQNTYSPYTHIQKISFINFNVAFPYFLRLFNSFVYGLVLYLCVSFVFSFFFYIYSLTLNVSVQNIEERKKLIQSSPDIVNSTTIRQMNMKCEQS